MTTKTKRELTLKSGLVIPAGSIIEVTVEKYNPTVATIVHDGGQFKAKTATLAGISNAFIKPTQAMLDAAINDSMCKSMTGARVEIDGWDEKGMPSVLLALGYA
jgi:hypothetical protein